MNLDTVPRVDREVIMTWEKATRALRSSRHETLHPEPAFIIASQAALQACLAVLRATGQQVIGRGQRQAIFSRVADLNAGELSRLARALDRMGKLRHEALYGSTIVIDAAQLAKMQELARRLFAAAYEWLRTTTPGLELTPPPG